MDNQNNQGHQHYHETGTECNGKDCMMNGRSHGCMFCNRHGDVGRKVVRIFLLIIIIAFSFWLGKEIGEFKGEYKGQYNGQRGYGMYDGGYMGMRYYIKNEDCTTRGLQQTQQSDQIQAGSWQEKMMR